MERDRARFADWAVWMALPLACCGGTTAHAVRDAGISTNTGLPSTTVPAPEDASVPSPSSETGASSSPSDGDVGQDGEARGLDDGALDRSTGPLEGSTCPPNAWTQPDIGCPSPDDVSAFGKLCAPLGIRCLERDQGPEPDYVAEQCEFLPYYSGPLWTWQARIYQPSDFDALPNEILLDASDCSVRRVTVCSCLDAGEADTAEGFLNSYTSLWEPTYGNPKAYVAFTNDGCAARVRYGNGTPATADFASRLTAAYAGKRWSCASSGTHFVMFHTVRPIGPQ